MQKENIDLKENSTANLRTSSLLNSYLTKENRGTGPILAAPLCFHCSSHCFKFKWGISIYTSGNFLWKTPASLRKWDYVQPKLSSSDSMSCAVAIPLDGAAVFQVAQIYTSHHSPLTWPLSFSYVTGPPSGAWVYILCWTISSSYSMTKWKQFTLKFLYVLVINFKER